MVLPTQAASLRAGITAATAGQDRGAAAFVLSRSEPSQKRPRAANRYTQIPRDKTAMVFAIMAVGLFSSSGRHFNAFSGRIVHAFSQIPRLASPVLTPPAQVC